jgi:hypothetical protein
MCFVEIANRRFISTDVELVGLTVKMGSLTRGKMLIKECLSMD